MTTTITFRNRSTMRLFLCTVVVGTVMLPNDADASGPGDSLRFMVKPDGRLAVAVSSSDDFFGGLAVESIGGHLGPGHEDGLDFFDVAAEIGGQLPFVAPFAPSANISGGQNRYSDVSVIKNTSHEVVLGVLGISKSIRPLEFVDTSVRYDLATNPGFCADLTVAASNSLAPSLQCVTVGDCNGDGVVSILDANCMSLHELGYFLSSNGMQVGDLDGTGIVDFTDFLKLSQNFGNSQVNYTDGDLDKDGSVGFADFLLLSANFGARKDLTIAPEQVVVPEAHSTLVLLLALAVGSKRNRRWFRRSRQ